MDLRTQVGQQSAAQSGKDVFKEIGTPQNVEIQREQPAIQEGGSYFDEIGVPQTESVSAEPAQRTTVQSSQSQQQDARQDQQQRKEDQRPASIRERVRSFVAPSRASRSEAKDELAALGESGGYETKQQFAQSELDQKYSNVGGFFNFNRPTEQSQDQQQGVPAEQSDPTDENIKKAMHDASSEGAGAPMHNDQPATPTKADRPVPSARRFRSASSKLKSRIQSAFSGKPVSVRGNNINSKLISDPSIKISIRDVSLGSEIAYASIMQNSLLLGRVNKAARAYNDIPGREEADKLNDNFDRQAFVDNPSDAIQALAETINTLADEGMGIYVTLTKSPVSEPESYQGHILRIHFGNGIAIHPLASKAYNADFDGDDAMLHLGTNNLKYARDAAAYFIGIDGSPKIDMDFMHLVDLVGVDEEDKVSETKKELGRMFPFLNDNIEDMDAFALAYVNKDAAALIKEIAKIKVVNGNYSERNRKMAMALDYVYDFGLAARREAMHDVIDQNDAFEILRLDDTSDLSSAEEEMLDWMKQQFRGQVPPNYQDFVVAVNRFSGDVSGKNPQFRVGADFAKLIKIKEGVYAGDENLKNLWEHVYSAIEAEIMSAKMYAAENRMSTIEYRNHQVRQAVKNRTGYAFISDSPDPEAWLDVFAEEYNRCTNIMEAGLIAARADMSLYRMGESKEHEDIPTTKGRKSDGGKVRQAQFKDYTSALVNVYGDYTLHALFGRRVTFTNKNERSVGKKVKTDQGWKQSLPAKYEYMSLRDFTQNNEMFIERPKKGDGYVSPDEIEPTLEANNNDTDRYFNTLVSALADKRTASARLFDKKIADNLEKQIKLIEHVGEGMSIKDSPNPDVLSGIKRREYDLKLELLYSSSPDMFAYYGMDSVEGFSEHEYGQMYLNAKDADSLGGIRMAMLAEQRLSSITRTAERIDENSDYREIVDAYEVMERETDALAASSSVWAVVVGEQKDGNKHLKKLFEDKGVTSRFATDALCYSAEAGVFETGKTYNSLMDVLLDPELPSSQKKAIVSDVARLRSGDPVFMSPYMVQYQMELNPPSAFSGANVYTYSEPSIDPMKASSDGMESFFKDQEARAEIYEEVSTWTNDDVEDILNYLSDPENAYVIPDEMYADAITACLDKSYPDSEKNSQMAVVSSYFKAVQQQRLGGVYSDVYRCGNRCIRKLEDSQVTRFDLVYALTHPEFEIEVYDPEGRTYILSRESICGGSDIEHVTAFIKSNPWMAMHLRPHGPSVIQGSDGQIFDVARSDVKNLLNLARDNAGRGQYENQEELEKKIQKSKSRRAVNADLAMLRDNPGWAGLVALFTPTKGRSSRMMRYAYTTTEKSLLSLVNSCKGKSREEVQDIVAKLLRPVAKYISAESGQGITIGSKGNPDESLGRTVVNLIYSMAGQTASTAEDVGVSYEGILWPDRSSVNAFYDARQVINGAKTSTSTSIEGAETDRNAAAFITFSMTPDIYSGGDNPIEAPNQDNTLFEGNGQITSLSRYLIVKRSKAGEEFNLKAKKAGTDNYNSMSFKFGSIHYKEFVSKVNGKYSEQDLWDAARQAVESNIGDRFEMDKALGQFLWDVNRANGYDDMLLSDYMNLAHMMIVERADGSIYIRSLEQISAALRANLGAELDSVNLSEVTPEQIHEASQRIISRIDGTKTGDIIDVVSGIRVRTMGSFRPATRQRSSSKERNVEAMRRIFNTAHKPSDNFELWSKNRREAWEYKLVKELDVVYPPKKDSDFANGFVANEATRICNSIGCTMVGIFSGRVTNYKAMPGASNAFVIRDDASVADVRKALDIAERHKMTVVFTKKAYDKFNLAGYDVQPASVKDGEPSAYMIPFFDMYVNDGGKPMSGSFRFDPKNVISVVEDSWNEFGLGDSSAKVFQDMLDRITIDQSGEYTDDVTRMFYNTHKEYAGPQYSFNYRMATDQEVSENICNPAAWEDGCPNIDTRIDDSNPDAISVKIHMSDQISDYIRTFTGENLKKTSTPDAILGWMVCEVVDGTGMVKKVYAPIIPYPTYGGSIKSAPSRFSVKKSDKSDRYFCDFDPNFGTIRVLWKNETGVDGQFFKFHEGISPANKMMMFGKAEGSRKFKDGRPVDVMVASATTASRRLGINPRIQSMYSMYLNARLDPFGFNFGDLETSFPDNPNLKERMRAGDITNSEWSSMLRDNVRLSSDEKLNEYLYRQIKHCLDRGIRPNDFLASKFYAKNEDGTEKEIQPYRGFQFDMAFIDASVGYQNDFMYFMNAMIPNLCPPSSEYTDESQWNGRGYLYKPEGSGSRKGCLLKQVPRTRDDGSTGYTWEFVTMSFGFFGDDYSGFHKPSLDAADMMMQELTSSIASGRIMKGSTLETFLRWSLRDYVPRRQMGAISLAGDIATMSETE